MSYPSAVKYRALVLDLDGTLVDDEGQVRPRTQEALTWARERGVVPMVATGRSELGALPVLRELDFETPAIVFNGAGLYCPRDERLLRHSLLTSPAIEHAFGYAEREDVMLMVAGVGHKYVSPPRDEQETRAVEMLEALDFRERDRLPRENLMRVSVFSARHGSSDAFARHFCKGLGGDVYLTWFPLNVLADQRGSALQVVDVQPRCRGKVEALDYLEQHHGIAADEVVCVGDGSNDVEMLTAAGLGVAMQNAMDCALDAADRVIGDNNSDALAELIEELFV